MLLDLTMPDLDGLEVLERLRAAGDDLPVCVLSAREQVSDRVRGLEAGADDYVVKPFALEEVSARLHALLRRRPLAADERARRRGHRARPGRLHRAARRPRPRAHAPRVRAARSSSSAIPARSSTGAACTRRSGATPSIRART